jgi:PAS domain S-box-containing protein
MVAAHKHTLSWSVGALIVLLLTLLISGLWLFRAEQQSARQRAEQLLASVAHGKGEQLAAWRQQRLQEGRGLSQVPLLRMDEEPWLRHFFASWVRPSATTNIVLLQTRNSGARQLAGLTMDEASRLQATVVPAGPDVFAALAAGGQTGAFRTLDHRGREALAVVVPVPDSDWLLMASDETANIFGVWRFRAALLVLLFTVLTGGVGCLALLFWQFQRKAHYKSLYDAEWKMRQSMERHSSILKAVGEGIMAIDGQGRIELLNPVAADLIGMNPQDPIGQPLAQVWQLLDEESRQTVADPVAAILSGELERDQGIARLLLTAGGIERSIAYSVAPIQDSSGVVVGAVLAFRDQSEQRSDQQLVHARLVLREYAQTHTLEELVTRALKELAVLVDSRAVCCQPVGRELPTIHARLGPQSGMIDSRWFELQKNGCRLAPPEHGQTIVRNDLASIPDRADQPRLGTVREMIGAVQRAGRTVALIGVADKAHPYTDRDRETLLQVTNFIWRLVEQKQVEEDLLASERRYRTLYQSMMDAFVVVDMEGRIRECNDAYGVMLGYSRVELKQLRLADITPSHWLAHEEAHVRTQLIHEGCSELYEKEYRRKDGTLLPVELRTFLLVDNDGRPEGMSAVVRDISKRKKAEAERERLRERLIQSQKMESVGQLAGGVAHDFNNMLSVILGYAELALRKMEVPDPLDTYLREIVRAGKRSTDITRQLLAFARKQNISPRLLDLNATLNGMLKILRRLIGEDIELQWLPGKDLWPVKIDPTQVDQLLANLCVNGRDAINGVGRITIETGNVRLDADCCAQRQGLVPGEYVLLAISDNGSGIDKALLDKIFEPFFTTKEVGRGTGLGLATVYGIVKQNNGLINVYSEPGEGTTFKVYLPRQEGTVTQDVVAEGDIVPLGQGETILVVEDEEPMLTLNRTMLEHLGYIVLTANTAMEALQLAKNHGSTIDVMIVDVIMPDMNGQDIARAMEPYCPRAKTLFMSGYTANVIAHRGVLDEGVFFLAKPFSTRDLAAAIRTALQG